jgi:hypothetical protein
MLYRFTCRDNATEAIQLNENVDIRRRRYNEAILGALFALFFLSMVSAVFALVPGFYSDVLSFFHDFVLTQIPNTSMYVFAPAVPSAHAMLYAAVAEFCLIWGIALFFILGIRFAARSSRGRKIETFTSIIFWLGAYYLVNSYLNAATTMTMYFVFWAMLAMLLGGSLIIRAFILLITR